MWEVAGFDTEDRDESFTILGTPIWPSGQHSAEHGLTRKSCSKCSEVHHEACARKSRSSNRRLRALEQYEVEARTAKRSLTRAAGPNFRQAKERIVGMFSGEHKHNIAGKRQRRAVDRRLVTGACLVLSLE